MKFGEALFSPLKVARTDKVPHSDWRNMATTWTQRIEVSLIVTSNEPGGSARRGPRRKAAGVLVLESSGQTVRWPRTGDPMVDARAGGVAAPAIMYRTSAETGVRTSTGIKVVQINRDKAGTNEVEKTAI